jgi:starvation-inducible DNA-binding protein
MTPNIGITAVQLQKSNDALALVLANEMTLYVKTRKFHWNVTGDSFMELHKLFESQYTALETSIDEVAERIGKLGGKTIGTMTEYLGLTQIQETPNRYPSQKEMLIELVADHEIVIVQIRKDVAVLSSESNDIGTADFLTGLLESHETMSWILRRYLN